MLIDIFKTILAYFFVIYPQNEQNGFIMIGHQISFEMTRRLQFVFIEDIRKTCPCNVYPLEPHIYIVKVGFAGVHLFFLFLLQNIDCGYSLEPPRRGGSNVYPQSMS